MYHKILKRESLFEYKKIVILRFMMANILICLLQYIGLILSAFPAPLNFATGTACAFIFLRGYYILPGIWFGCYFAEHNIQCATVYAVQAFLILFYSYRLISPTLIFYRYRVLIHFILLSAFLAGISAWILHPGDWIYYGLSNLNGILIISLGLVAWDAYFPQIYLLKKHNKPIVVLYYSLLIFFSIALLFSREPWEQVLLSMTTLPILLGVGNRLGWCGVLSVLFLFGLILNLGAFLGAPLFTTYFSWDIFMFLQVFLLMETIIGLLFSFSKFFRTMGSSTSRHTSSSNNLNSGVL